MVNAGEDRKGETGVRIGVTIWGEIISPVFDVARSMLIADIADQRIVSREQVPIFPGSPTQQMNCLRRNRIDVLICGAVSEVPAGMIEAAGIRLIPFIRGNVNDVLYAFLNNQLPAADFMMPGCGKRSHRRRRGRHRR